MLPLVALMAVSVSMVTGEKQVLSIHGSGTTNPNKCFWHVMDKMEARSKLPMHMTYRGIGSTDGQTEFNITPPVTYFASGDVPLTQELYKYLSATEVIFQMPIFLSAVSFFHSVPNTPKLTLTPCTLAKIMKRDITEWNHPDITSINPNLSLPSEGLPIRVARRTDGASSTAGIAQVSIRYRVEHCLLFWRGILMAHVFCYPIFSTWPKLALPNGPPRTLAPPSIGPKGPWNVRDREEWLPALTKHPVPLDSSMLDMDARWDLAKFILRIALEPN